jgi:AcrR family transcriptional regulator
MPYAPKLKQQSRQRILESAAHCFLCQGYERTGIDEIMQRAGMTRGAFYAHFSSKSELYAKAMLHAASYSKLVSKGRRIDKSEPDLIQSLLDGYLSLEHANGEEKPCPMAFLVTDVASRDPEVRQTYTQIYKRMNRIIGKMAAKKTAERSEEVFAVTALMIGGVALARAMADDQLADKLLASCRQAAAKLLESGGSD